ncbi:hypothetical protein CONLIGDRAFT_686635 [Coniochaeta ligniaria NRRL 30616]|uniref:Uncharacterized protein n=1 Tax=Coniochaeta ligniaria NRRL 30616 TaxID=1408157 RepID=A0A1J7I8M4_9PEZI|nr:hypothetical protein CONLIGDRAFT_686635 [Coniochaeta ligniaria NRRL 30616]
MSPVSLLLNQLLSRDAVELGRLVLRPECPDQEFKQPEATPETQKTPLTNLMHAVDSEKGVKLKLGLDRLLSAWLTIKTNTSTELSSHTFASYQLRNSDTYFRKACQEPAVREFLETQARRRFGQVFLTCGFKTLEDAHVEQARGRENEMGAGVSVPVSLVAAAATGGMPLPPVLPGADAEVEVAAEVGPSKSRETAKFDAPGEQVFAVQYRKIRFSWFSSRDKVDAARLEAGNRWELYGPAKGEGGEDVLEAGLEGDAGSSAFASGDYESVDLDGETFVFLPDEAEEEEVVEMRH